MAEFAKSGPIAPHFTRLPQNPVTGVAKGTLNLEVEAQSLPGAVVYQWYAVDRDNTTEHALEGENSKTLQLSNLMPGKVRFRARAWDSITEACVQSHIIIVEVDDAKPAFVKPATLSRLTPTVTVASADSRPKSNRTKYSLERTPSHSDKSYSRQTVSTDLDDSEHPSNGRIKVVLFLIVFLILLGIGWFGKIGMFKEWKEKFEEKFPNSHQPTKTNESKGEISSADATPVSELVSLETTTNGRAQINPAKAIAMLSSSGTNYTPKIAPI